MWRRGRGRRFAESNEDELSADGMPGQLKCRHDLEPRTSFSGSVGSGFLGITGIKSVGKYLSIFLTGSRPPVKTMEGGKLMYA